MLSLWKNRELISQLVRRDLASRYRGSLLGIVWSFVTPLLLQAVYTFVFGVVFQSRWNHSEQGPLEFALALFCGLTAFNVFAETVNRSPTIVVGNPNYIKRVVFPLEVLPLTVLVTAIVNGLISLIVLLIASLFVHGQIHWTVLLLPIVLLPLLLVSLGLGWFLSALGVYVRDIAHIVPLAVTCLLFLSPIFYPLEAIPERVRFLFSLNPLSFVVEDTRRVVLWGLLPRWEWIAYGLVIGALISALGFIWFQKTRKGFADVV
jgi:lipopolysaccharide transport system permease protein